MAPGEGTVSEKLCRLDELPNNAGHAIKAGGKALALFRIDDVVYALDNICPHWGGPLADGIVSVVRTEVACPWHRFRYDLKSGNCVVSSSRQGAQTYPVTVRDGEVYVDLIDHV